MFIATSLRLLCADHTIELIFCNIGWAGKLTTATRSFNVIENCAIVIATTIRQNFLASIHTHKHSTIVISV